MLPFNPPLLTPQFTTIERPIYYGSLLNGSQQYHKHQPGNINLNEFGLVKWYHLVFAFSFARWAVVFSLHIA